MQAEDDQGMPKIAIRVCICSSKAVRTTLITDRSAPIYQSQALKVDRS